ncbi:phosphate ABC transporter permease subunit PstC [Alloalcanivorax xenomutans]|jgi:phosphate transport system permease protein|uniref:Phosphate transport system permease protein n=1 Tax=Alloalcanivorax xenomutans TaxID=1094342 RepID=A0A9Q3W2U3_9GAMM|nr:phosphate ABC transporter permease subunit PstC [Alloalcanivorax xenomutans]ERS09374.1 phosphate ABC transporter permease [Alcanivorax sp. PN-3]KYZ85674.1 phosphate ABC transporter permease [Alcanivorax sp. KX64203]MBA4719768.1 phosphate ABC transporter permease subunit PstC [Alcanivorax sp.]ARB47629.1 phosphate ABC transporter permease [Alloalcanivorax xenomutans]MCE7507501.1 phosphate ABC transporter permease subunit PstC [Alloalcanivorax xenomutans]|tara:strand:+ start:980 stop:2368 length:1389 start_codon:yes stop_codon:yes gene_type:complete
MQTGNLLLLLIVMVALAYYLGHQRSLALARPLGGIRHLHSLPFYYAMRAALWCALPALLILGAWLAFDDTIIRQTVMQGLPDALRPDSDGARGLLLSQIQNVASGSLSPESVDPAIAAAAERLNGLRTTSAMALTVVVIAVGLIGAAWGWVKIAPQLRARQQVESILRVIFMLCATVAILTTVGILMSVLFESIRFFQKVSPAEFLFGLQWSPQTALRTDQVASSGAFGAIPLFVGTLLISSIALLVAVPIGLMSAIYLAEYAPSRVRSVAKPMLEILAGVPTVVYGFFAALTVAPFIRGVGETLGLDVASESALAAGLVMGVMIIPFVSSLSDDVITAVPQVMRDGSLGLGATRSETIRKVVFPAALPGIMGGILLAASRAIGETMIVVMAAGLAANLTANPLEAVTTVTVQIVTLLTGDQEFDSAKTLAAFALGLMLFLTTLCLNILALHIVKKYREQYE